MQYDSFQLKAISAIDEGKSVLVSAPTGAGKTAIAEYAIVKALSRGERVIYTAPIKALSNQKYRDFSALYPDQVGLLTGDVSLNPRSPLVIMTTEIYRNQLFEDPAALKQTSTVIFDEVHYLDDQERGTVWEEAIMFTPSHIRLLALSATAPNIQEVAEWIRSILQHPVEVIIETHRPVPLVHLFQCQGRIFSDAQTLKKDGYLNFDSWGSQNRRPSGRRNFHRNRFSGGQKNAYGHLLKAKPNRLDDLVKHLLTEKRLPCLYFAFGRKRTEELAWEMEHFDFLTPDEKTQVETLYKELCARFDLTQEASAINLRRLISRGIAFHHAGMLPTLKEVIERLFTSKLIKLIFTTETFALGINMPAKTVVFDELRKFYGTHFGFLRTRDYFQMAGRAGRRGMDSQGFVYSRVNPHWMQHPVLVRIIFGQPEPIESQFNSCYATLLNLYSQLGSKLIEVYPRSFHYFTSNKKERQHGVGSLEQKIALLRELGHIRDESLTEKGLFASWMYGYELLLAEMLEDHYLDSLNEVSLCVLLSALIYEPRRNQFARELPSHLKSIEKNSNKYLRFIHSRERIHRIEPLTKQPQFHLALAVEAWVRGLAFHELERYTDTDEGEMIRYLRMVNQLLRQLKNAPQVSERLRSVASSAQKKINRDLVDAEKQLRNL